jgi:hypothetical protein
MRNCFCSSLRILNALVLKIFLNFIIQQRFISSSRVLQTFMSVVVNFTEVYIYILLWYRGGNSITDISAKNIPISLSNDMG